MTTLFGLTAIALGIYAIVLQNRIDELKGSLWEVRTQLHAKEAENERLMDCIIDIENEMGEQE